MNELASSAVFWIFAMTVLGVLFLLPTLIGLIRGVDALGLVILFNLIGAPTLIGWPAALILAFGPRRLPPPAPTPFRPYSGWYDLQAPWPVQQHPPTR